MSFLFSVVLNFSVAVVMSIIAYVWLSRLFSSMKITKKQLLKTLLISLIGPAIVIAIFFVGNPQHLNFAEPLTYAWELVLLGVWVYLLFCRSLFFHFGKKNLGNAYKSTRSEHWM